MRYSELKSNRKMQRNAFLLALAVLALATGWLLHLNPVYFSQEKWIVMGSMALEFGGLIGFVAYFRSYRMTKRKIELDLDVPMETRWAYVHTSVPVPLLTLAAAFVGFCLFHASGASLSVHVWHALVTLTVMGYLVADNKYRWERFRQKMMVEYNY